MHILYFKTKLALHFLMTFKPPSVIKCVQCITVQLMKL